MFFIFFYFQILICQFLLYGCFLPSGGIKYNPNKGIKIHEEKIGLSSQIIIVRDESFLVFKKIKLYTAEKNLNNWHKVFEPMDAVIGSNGFANPDEKREGDGKTPSGIFPLKIAFGYQELIKSKMPYRQILSDDIWVDDIDAEDYNQWTKINQTKATSYERMKRTDDLYKYGIVIGYNTDPVIYGKGSAIFLHVWKDKNSPTTGCVAVSEENMFKLLQWLDPTKLPLIIIGP